MKRIGNTVVIAMLIFGLLPVQARAAEWLIPVGKVIGLQLSDDTLTVAAYDDSHSRCARDAGIRIGDEIVQINKTQIDSVQDVRRVLSDCTGEIAVTVRREGRNRTVKLAPTQTEEGARLGLYLRQGIAGIGTVTWYDPETGKFGALGHGVNDSKGKLLTMRQGNAFSAEVISIKKGTSGDPGQLKGSADGREPFAPLLRNTPQGVFGVTKTGWQGEKIPVADYEEVQAGPATIRSTIQGEMPQEYSVEILKIYPEDRPDNRNFLLKVTDPALLSATGGIVQGMSGSPLVQDGKLIGAVTHVLVNDPTMGYGIFIENMLEAAG